MWGKGLGEKASSYPDRITPAHAGKSVGMKADFTAI